MKWHQMTLGYPLFQLISLYQKELYDPSATLQAVVKAMDWEYLHS